LATMGLEIDKSGRLKVDPNDVRIVLLNLPDDVLDALRIGQIADPQAQALARLKDTPPRNYEYINYLS
ncbi:MAG: hypothetical protein SVX43_08880, partial [Cyanobacteriota bacterium]|nr:hypothetical protein [Cyanobacteriota bacterium]